jgi:guanylate kinase
MKKGVLFIVCGPSGVGKTSLSRQLLEARPQLTLSVSYTTRAAREGEKDGADYHFVDPDTFKDMRDREQFAEWAKVHGNFYGTPVSGIQAAWEDGKDVLFDIDYQGARQLEERFSEEARGVLVIPPSMAVLEQRLRGRATDAEDVIERRLEGARHELEQFELYDYILENDDFGTALEQLMAIYDASRCLMPLNRERMKALLDGSCE